MKAVRNRPVTLDTIEKWLRAIVWAVVGLVAMGFGAGVWATSMNARMGAIEKWQSERSAAIEDYHKWQQAVESRLASIDARAKDGTDRLDRMDTKLDRILERR